MNGWILGYLIGAAVVVVVVVALVLMISGARRTADKAEGVLAALNDTRDGTAGLWQLGGTVQTVERIAAAAQDARLSLTPAGRS